MERRRSGSSSDGSRGGCGERRLHKPGTETKWKYRNMPAGATRPRPPAPIKNQQAISLRFFPGPCGSACVQHAEPSLAETRCIANKLLYRKISHCLVHSQTEKQCPLAEPDLWMVITGGETGYTNEKGVHIIPVSALKP